ncbi:transcriptional regulator PpsR [Alterisphingorhabdus coralli]|uniref:Transcriptional regulator PpsR n=1 Tax=Alterisphingorhabdus coralli TaxID=3071408 RepID=A0AA97F7J3_9SPHN|nr:transcriptional regulator PpsR [Parasphingorhabdus sp. SCSIO 66989]WOE74532.1 transcriptional regulator PpsR [Parasphingorhabdus sp. SCSIO 66989]
MNFESTGDHRIPFSDPDSMFEGFSREDILELAYSSGDFILAIDENEIVRDVAVNSKDHRLAQKWVGKKWSDTVSAESKAKVQKMLQDGSADDQTWRQVNHVDDGDDIPVNYRILRPSNTTLQIAIGRDIRSIALLQQRLLKTQQSMERDYLNLRQTETRYRLLFDNISYPVLIVDSDTYQIQQANRASHGLINAAPGALENKGLLELVERDFRDDIIAYMGAISVSGKVDPVSIRLEGRTGFVKLSASAFRQSGRQYWLINIDDGQHEVPGRSADQYILDVVEKMPDAFVLADENQDIIVANRAFVELVQAGAMEQILGVSLNRFVGRPDVDLNLLRKQLKDHQDVRNFSSVVNDLNGGEEPVEISAIMVERDQPLYGYSVRGVGRRERDLPETSNELPRSVDQLTELVGRKPLKEIVRESTDLIERMCIEAALVHTSDNRASAAEILGLSRQSLYSKLHRHGLGNLTGKGDN